MAQLFQIRKLDYAVSAPRSPDVNHGYFMAGEQILALYGISVQIRCFKCQHVPDIDRSFREHRLFHGDRGSNLIRSFCQRPILREHFFRIRILVGCCRSIRIHRDVVKTVGTGFAELAGRCNVIITEIRVHGGI